VHCGVDPGRFLHAEAQLVLFPKADFAAVAITLIGTLLLGVEVGISLGVSAPRS
jgi:hypothetical protein